MKKIFFFYLGLILYSLTFSQAPRQYAATASYAYRDTFVKMDNIIIPDSAFRNLSNALSNKENWWEKNIFSIISLVISLMISIMTIIVSLYVTNKNIESSKENLRTQFENQKQSLDRQLIVQLATTVDKEWIEELRNALVEFLEQLWFYYQIRTQPNSNGKSDEQIQGIIDKLMLAKDKCAILLDVADIPQHNLISKLDDIYAQITKTGATNIDMPQLRHELFNSLHKITASKRPSIAGNVS